MSTQACPNPMSLFRDLFFFERRLKVASSNENHLLLGHAVRNKKKDKKTKPNSSRLFFFMWLMRVRVCWLNLGLFSFYFLFFFESVSISVEPLFLRSISTSTACLPLDVNDKTYMFVENITTKQQLACLILHLFLYCSSIPRKQRQNVMNQERVFALHKSNIC